MQHPPPPRQQPKQQRPRRLHLLQRRRQQQQLQRLQRLLLLLCDCPSLHRYYSLLPPSPLLQLRQLMPPLQLLRPLPWSSLGVVAAGGDVLGVASEPVYDDDPAKSSSRPLETAPTRRSL